MNFLAPPACQGQIVEVAYAETPDGLIRRIYDRSDRTTQYHVMRWTAALIRWSDAIGPANAEPPVSPQNRRWRRIDAPREVSL